MRLRVDVVYDRSLHNLKTRPMIIPPQLTAGQRRDAVMDHYQSIRTNILLAWVLTNASPNGLPATVDREDELTWLAVFRRCWWPRFSTATTRRPLRKVVARPAPKSVSWAIRDRNSCIPR